MANITMRMETEHFIKKLGKSGNRLQIAAAEALNDQAEKINRAYEERLTENQTIRTRYTLNSVKTYKANPIRKSGEPRPLHNINAITGVRKMRGGEEHYLYDLEVGGAKRGNRKTKNRVAIPLDTARTSMSNDKPIAGANRLTKAEPQTLMAGGKAFGTGQTFTNPRQRFAALYKYKRKGTDGLSGDLSKPFYFSDNNGNLGIFKFIRNTAKKIRNLEHTRIMRKSTGHFYKSVKTVTPRTIQAKFISIAKGLIRGI